MSISKNQHNFFGEKSFLAKFCVPVWLLFLIPFRFLTKINLSLLSTWRCVNLQFTQQYYIEKEQKEESGTLPNIDPQSNQKIKWKCKLKKTIP